MKKILENKSEYEKELNKYLQLVYSTFETQKDIIPNYYYSVELITNYCKNKINKLSEFKNIDNKTINKIIDKFWENKIKQNAIK